MSIAKVEIILGTSNYEKWNRGLRKLIMLIGRNEVEKKAKRAKQAGKTRFTFHTGKRSRRIKCDIGNEGSLPRSVYYKAGLECINKLVKRGNRNKGAIKALVRFDSYRRVVDRGGDRTNHVTYRIDRFLTSIIFTKIYQYIEAEFSVPDKLLGRIFDELPKNFSGMNRKGTIVVATPYLSQIYLMDDFWKKTDILDSIERFDHLLF